MRRFLMVVLIAVVAVGMLSCGPLVLKNKDIKKWPIPVTAEAPAFMFPVNLNHCGTPGNNLANGIAVTGVIAAKYGKTVISGQQLFDLVGNLSYELAEEIYYQVKKDTWTMTGHGERVATALAGYMNRILDKLAALKLIKKGFKFKYIIALHSHGNGSTTLPMNAGTLYKMVSWGGMYDIETKMICSYLEADDSVKVATAGPLAKTPIELQVGPQLGNIYNGIIGNLIKGE